MRKRSKGLFFLGSLIALGILLISTTQLAAQEPPATVPVTVPATSAKMHLPLIQHGVESIGLPIETPEPTLPVPTLPAVEPRLWLPQLYDMAVAPTLPPR
ncbi:MAG: hypothetical protein GX552_11970 [Chloroflexi bacterium]|jgi:hypothetical protein|nr:hypothetical protein [Chloroflexota bacterium]